ncbi:MAG: hypothetical protein ABI083_15175 [Lapillicoccus sp.]
MTHYPAILALQPGATPAGDGPIGPAIAAFTWCVTGPTCDVVLQRVDGTQVTLLTDVGDTPVSLSPDGTWLVYLRRDATILRNLLTGATQRLPTYRRPLSWSPNSRWLMFEGNDGGDFIVRDVVSGVEGSNLHPLPAPTASVYPTPPPPGPYYPAAVTDHGQVVRYERPDTPTPVGTFALDVVDPASMAARPIPVSLNSPSGLRPAAQVPAAPLLGDTLYLKMSLDGAMSLLPLSVTTGHTGAVVRVTAPGSTQPVRFTADPIDPGWTTVAALPGQGLVCRVKGRGANGDDLVAVDPTTGRSRQLTHIREGWPAALAALPGR